MTNQRRKKEESSPKVPAYIVTFSDMTTLLLTFFVMLLSLAHIQDPELYGAGRDSFLNSMANFGLEITPGIKTAPDFGEDKLKHSINKPDKSFDTRNIDAREEKLRRIFKEVNRSMTTMHSQIVAKKTNFSVTNISFSPDNATLDEPAKRFLRQFAANLQAGGRPGAIKLYVLGLAGDVRRQQKQWIISARRAQAVSDFLGSILPTELQWPIYSWGAGAGELWVGGSSQLQILIAVLRTND